MQKHCPSCVTETTTYYQKKISVVCTHTQRERETSKNDHFIVGSQTILRFLISCFYYYTSYFRVLLLSNDRSLGEVIVLPSSFFPLSFNLYPIISISTTEDISLFINLLVCFCTQKHTFETIIDSTQTTWFR